jgi:hypothetical protein
MTNGATSNAAPANSRHFVARLGRGTKTCAAWRVRLMATLADAARLAAEASKDFTSLVVSRAYPDDVAGRRLAVAESGILLAHGYEPAGSSVYNDSDRHLNVRRTAANVLLTGGIGLVLFGASRSSGKNYLSAMWTLEIGDPLQPREVIFYGDIGVKAITAHVQQSGFLSAHFEAEGTARNVGEAPLEAAEMELCVYSVPDLTRIDLARVRVTDLQPGVDRPFSVRFSGEHPTKTKAVILAVPRRALPFNGIWSKPTPYRTLWASVFPDSEYVRRY